MASIFLEAEAFNNPGGWVIDPQSMDQMGSAYLMAHGMGNPVADAETVCDIPESAEWHLFARTRNWTAVWKRGHAAGIFQLKIDDVVIPKILGDNSAEWEWVNLGSMRLEAGSHKLALHDLTGFNGRCDALYLTTDPADIPPNEKKALDRFRREKLPGITDDPVEYDLIVIGGGVAGICTAISALKEQLKVLLIQDRSVLGGCNSSEVRVGMGGMVYIGDYPKLGTVVTEIEPVFGSGGTYDAEYYEDARKEIVFRFEGDRYTIRKNERAVAIETDPADPKKITAVITRGCRTGLETRYRGRLFSDCTGDAVIARLAGAEFMYGREAKTTFDESLAPEKADRQVMGDSVLWIAKKKEKATVFPDIDWGLEITEDKAYYIRGGDWEWETGQYRDQTMETEYIRDYGLMAIFANWSFLKNHSKRKEEWACETLDWVSPCGGKRESCRVVGDLILNQRDIEEKIQYPDGTAATTWSIDLHFPDPENVEKFEEAFRSCAYHRGIREPYAIPYRCLYARDVKNLFLGGRHISLSHIAFSSIRVMRTLGMLGEVVGMAAAICKEENALPRDVYTKHLDRLKERMTRGCGRSTYHSYTADTQESYHFKDLGYLNFAPECPWHVKEMSAEALRRIRKLDMSHINPLPPEQKG